MANLADLRSEINNATNYYGPTVSVTIGKDKPLLIHTSILGQTSAYFKDKIKAHKDNQATLRISLPFEEPDIFKCYVTYLYTGHIPCKNSGASDENSEDADPDDNGYDFTQSIQREYNVICKLYILSQKLRDPKAQDSAISAMLARYMEVDARGFHCVPKASTVTEVYQHLEEGSPLRRALVDIYSWGCSSGVFKERDFFKCPEFVKDLATALLAAQDRKTAKVPAKVDCCDYHHHTELEECQSRKRKRSSNDESGSDENDAMEDENEVNEVIRNQEAAIERLRKKLADIKDAINDCDREGGKE